MDKFLLSILFTLSIDHMNLQAFHHSQRRLVVVGVVGSNQRRIYQYFRFRLSGPCQHYIGNNTDIRYHPAKFDGFKRGVFQIGKQLF